MVHGTVFNADMFSIGNCVEQAMHLRNQIIKFQTGCLRKEVCPVVNVDASSNTQLLRIHRSLKYNYVPKYRWVRVHDHEDNVMNRFRLENIV